MYYIYVCGHLCIYVVYVLKEISSFPGAQSTNGRATLKNVRSSSTDQQKESCVTYIETGTNS